MRIAHLADLHLGKVFHGTSLVEDQHHVLGKALDALRREDIDVLVLAGDLYDRALPGKEAVRLLDGFLREVNQGLKIPVIAIAGNHDSGDHLGFGAWLFSEGDVHVRGRVEPEVQPITLGARDGEVTFYPLPFVEPEGAREMLQLAESADTALTHRDIVRALLKQARAHAEAHAVERAVVIAHGFVQGDRPPEESRRSERTLYLGGAGAVPASDFQGFAYTALGHLHRPQDVTAGGRVRYAGSLLKYSFDEAPHSKGMTIATLDPRGGLQTEHVALAPRRDLAMLRGSLASLLSDPALDHAASCFVCAELTDVPPPPQAMERLRKRFPFASELRFAAVAPVDVAALAGTALAVQDPSRVFDEFFARYTGATPSEDERAVFRQALAAGEGAST